MFDANVSQQYPRSVAGGREAGLARFFASVYGWMASGIAVSGVVALAAVTNAGLIRALATSPVLMIAIVLVQLGIAGVFSARAREMSTFAAANLFFGYAASMGLLLAPLAYIYTGSTLVQAFAASATAVAATGLYGLTTKRSLTPLASFFTVGLIGGMVLLLINAFVQSAALDFAVNMALLLVFNMIMAWHHQQLKATYAYSGAAGNLALVGAFTMYCSFINVMVTLLRLFGDRREDS